MTCCQKHQVKVRSLTCSSLTMILYNNTIDLASLTFKELILNTDNFYFESQFKSLIYNEQILDVPGFNVHR
jgi:hypothetical protein